MAQKSSNRLIRKLLFANQDKKQLFYAFFGVLIGFVFISVSFHYLIEINMMGKSSEIMNSNTITIQKKVSTGSTLSLSNHSFSDQEIHFYKSLHFIERVVAVENNNFPVELKSNDPLVPYFRSDIFIQSIPFDFLDVKSSLWNWGKGNKIVPIILPRDFVYMMNNFLSSTGMPQLSDEILKDVSFQLQLGDGENKLLFDAKIIGFTNEISSILVPESFMKFGCSIYANNIENPHSQLMLKSKKGQFGLIEELIQRNHLEVKKNQMVEGKLKSMLTILLSSISFISLIVVFVSLIVLIQYLQLLITKNAYEIRTLLRIGVPIRNIVVQYIKYIFIGLVLVLFFIIVVDYFVFTQINLILNSAGFAFENANYSAVFILVFVLFISVFISSIISVNKFVKKEF